ncbi:hypothetical protein BH23CHL4_BH23CHL4_18450 [soil metagenome]
MPSVKVRKRIEVLKLIVPERFAWVTWSRVKPARYALRRPQRPYEMRLPAC